MAEGPALILGLGNVSRRDDGFGWYAVNMVRRSLGLEALGETDDGMDDLGQEVDTVFLPQISSDLADLVAGYDHLVIVDARIGGGMRVYWEEVAPPTHDHSRLLTHDMLPSELLAVTRALFGQAPRTFLVSVPGLSFDFAVGLTEPVAEQVGRAADLCLELARGFVPVSATE